MPVDRIFFAVKTTESYHGRCIACFPCVLLTYVVTSHLRCCLVNVIKRTWKRDDLLITFFSNVTDPSIPTEDTGVPNVERGNKSDELIINILNFGLLASETVLFSTLCRNLSSLCCLSILGV